MMTGFGRGAQEGAIAGAIAGFAGNWSLVLGIVLSAQLSEGGGFDEWGQSLLLGFVIGFVGMFIGTPTGGLIGVVVGGLYGVLGIRRAAPLITATLMAAPLPITSLATATEGSATLEETTVAEWGFGLLVIGSMAALGYGAGAIWRNGMRRHASEHSPARRAPKALAGVGE